MPSRSVLLSAAAIVLAGCAASPGGQLRSPVQGCPINFKPYCEVSGHHTKEAPGRQQCRCVRHSDINGMLSRDY